MLHTASATLVDEEDWCDVMKKSKLSCGIKSSVWIFVDVPGILLTKPRPSITSSAEKVKIASLLIAT
jgi:hypothetical protein